MNSQGNTDRLPDRRVLLAGSPKIWPFVHVEAIVDEAGGRRWRLVWGGLQVWGEKTSSLRSDAEARALYRQRLIMELELDFTRVRRCLDDLVTHFRVVVAAINESSLLEGGRKASVPSPQVGADLTSPRPSAPPPEDEDFMTEEGA